MPDVVRALLALAQERPSDIDPVACLAAKLLAIADERDTAATDPYDAPIYAERRELVAVHEQRAAETAAAAAAKAEREAAARAEAEARLAESLMESLKQHESMLRG